MDLFEIWVRQSRGHIDPFVLAIEPPYFSCEFRSVVTQFIISADRITPGSIILCHFNTVLLAVNIHNDHSAGVENLCFLFLFHHLNHSPGIYFSRVTVIGGCCTVAPGRFSFLKPSFFSWPRLWGACFLFELLERLFTRLFLWHWHDVDTFWHLCFWTLSTSPGSRVSSWSSFWTCLYLAHPPQRIPD